MVYIEYHTVRIGSPHPLPPHASVSPPWTQRGEQHSLAGEGAGAQLGRLGRMPDTLYTLCVSQNKRAIIKGHVTQFEVFSRQDPTRGQPNELKHIKKL